MNFFKSLLAAFLGVLLALMLLFFLSFVLLVGFISSATEKPAVTVPQNAVLEVDLARPIQDQAADDPFAAALGDVQALRLHEVTRAIRAAKSDDRIRGIYLNSGFVGGGMASVEAIRDALLDFRSSGKFIYAYNEFYTEKAYYLATAADSIFLYPQGVLEWNGLAATPMFLRGALDKLGIEPLVFKVGTFKSATEMFTQEKMSDASRLQTRVLLNDMWRHMVAGIAARRKLDTLQLNRLANNLAIDDAKSAIRAGLLDGQMSEREVFRLIRARLDGKPYVPADSSGETDYKRPRAITLANYIRASEASNLGGADQIAVVFAEGEIVSGSGDNGLVGSETMVKAIRKVAEDDRVKAIVLRVNSPGGSSLASDVIWRELEHAKTQKPVVASFGDVAASGGYYIAAGADQIVAQPNTITGSIGIFGMWVNTRGFFNDKLGITFDRVTTNEHADLANPNRPLDPVEARYIQNLVNQGYSDFVEVVRRGRNFPDSAAVDQIAQGRVWSGVRAFELHLVDTLGGLDVAVALAARKAGLGEDYSVVSYPNYPTWFERLAGGLNTHLRAVAFRMFLAEEQVALARALRRFDDPRHTYLLMPQVPDIR